MGENASALLFYQILGVYIPEALLSHRIRYYTLSHSQDRGLKFVSRSYGLHSGPSANLNV